MGFKLGELFLLLLIVCTAACETSICGPKGILNPCKCSPEGDIDCRGVGSTQELTNSLSTKKLNSLDQTITRNAFYMTNTEHVTKFPSNLLKPLKFRHFYMFGNNGLYVLESGAFNGSENTAKTVDLSNCHINDTDVFNYVLKKLLVLESVNLSHNELLSVTRKAFGKQNFLKKIDLSYNKISYIGKQCFEYLVALEEVNLSHNHIYGYSGNPFLIEGHNPSSFMKIDLSYNRIQFISTENLKDITHVQVLDLSYNLIASMYEEGYGPLLRQLNFNRGDALIVTGNPLDCNCVNKWLHSWPQVRICCENGNYLSDMTLEELSPCTYNFNRRNTTRNCRR